MKTSKYKHMGQPMSPIIAVGIGIGVSMIVSLLLSAIAAWLVSGERLPQSAIGGSALPVQLVSTFAGCITAVLISGKMPAIIASACAGGYFAILICINILVLDSSLSGIGKGIFAVLGGAALSVLASLLTHKNKKHKKLRAR